jgi:hypothetical protein
MTNTQQANRANNVTKNLFSLDIARVFLGHSQNSYPWSPFISCQEKRL